MKGKRYHYLITFEYLGFRYHGWQKQTVGIKTVQSMMDKTIAFILEHEEFKTLGSSRTDAMVSAHKTVCKLTIKKDDDREPEFLQAGFDKNLPKDIRVTKVERTTRDFSIITGSKKKVYHYYFCLENRPSPFIAPFMSSFAEDLDIEKMMEAAKIYQGTHNFRRYCYRPSPDTIFEREILEAEIVENTEITASFFPEKTYVFKVVGAGFMRHQVRLMMGALVDVGSGWHTMESFKETLKGNTADAASFIAPSSGLVLKDIAFK